MGRRTGENLSSHSHFFASKVSTAHAPRSPAGFYRPRSWNVRRALAWPAPMHGPRCAEARGAALAIPYAGVMRLLLAMVFLFLLAGMLPAAAQTVIHRCVDAQGNPAFTDQPCATLDATPMARSPTKATVAGPPAPVMLCASNASQLKRVVIDAFAERDANRLAAVMLWGGYGAHAAVADIRALQSSMRRPLLDLRTEPAGEDDGDLPAEPSSTAPGQDPVPTALIVDTGASDDPDGVQALRFDVLQRAGCLWLRSAGTGPP